MGFPEIVHFLKKWLFFKNIDIFLKKLEVFPKILIFLKFLKFSRKTMIFLKTSVFEKAQVVVSDKNVWNKTLLLVIFVLKIIKHKPGGKRQQVCSSSATFKVCYRSLVCTKKSLLPQIFLSRTNDWPFLKTGVFIKNRGFSWKF